MSHIIGLAVGIASVGWGVIDTDKAQIIDAGVRVFTKAEAPKTGSSLAEPRRLARSTRKRLRRRHHRLQRLKDLFVASGLIANERRETAFRSAKHAASPWQLRDEGLTQRLLPEDLARALFHIARRRGFKSNRKSELRDKDVGKLLAGVKENTRLLKQGSYRTVGEMFFEAPRFAIKKRNHAAFYGHTVARELLVSEVEILFQRQRELGSRVAAKQLEEDFLTIFSSQRSFDDGDQINRMRSFCAFERKQQRAAKLSYSAERFVLASKCSSLRFGEEGKARQQLSLEQRCQLIELALQLSKLSYKQLRQKLNIHEASRFVGLNYTVASKQGKDPEEQIFIELKGFHALKKAIEKKSGEAAWTNLVAAPTQLDTIAEILTCWKTDDNRQRELLASGIPQALIDAVIPLNMFSQFINLSTRAIHRLLPLMEQGVDYDQACSKIYHGHRQPGPGQKRQLLPLISFDDIHNPLAFRALTQARKVINGIIRKHGSADRVHIEASEELTKTFQQRKRIENGKGQFRRQKQQAREQFSLVYGYLPSGYELHKFRLYQAQKGRCPYSGEAIDSQRLVEPGYVEIDHILPWSRTFDDSLNNKVLALSAENQHKGNQTSFEYIAKQDPDSTDWQRFKAQVADYPLAKRWRLLKQNLDQKEVEVFRQRNGTDSSYIARYLKNFIQHNLRMAGSDKRPVQTCNATQSNYLRVRWGLLKDADESERYHGIDALVVAGVFPNLTKELAEVSREQELGRGNDPEARGKIHLPQPWEGFSQAVRDYVDNEIFVSRMPCRKLTGAAHQETVRSAKHLDEGYAVVKTPLSNLTLQNLESLHDKQRNLSLYTALKARLAEYEGNGKKAFEEPFYMPLGAKKTKRDSVSPLVKSVKLRVSMNDGVPINKGIAAHDSMIRTDVFERNGQYYLVPIYVADRVKEELPNRAITQRKAKSDWLEMDENCNFCFSLHRNDLIEIKHKTKGRLLCYYAGCHSSTGAINITLPDRSLPPCGDSWISEAKLAKMREKGDREIQGIGIKTGLEHFHKYEVDMLGAISRVHCGGDRLRFESRQ